MEKEELACIRTSVCDPLEQKHCAQRKLAILREFEVAETKCINCRKVLALNITAFGGTANCKERIDGSRSLSRVFALPAVLLVLNMVDVLMTEYGLSVGHIEVNPLFSFASIPAKFLGCIALFATSYLQNRLSPKGKMINDTVVCIVVIVYLFVVGNNALAIIHAH